MSNFSLKECTIRNYITNLNKKRDEGLLREHKQFENFISTWSTEFLAAGKKVHCQNGCSGCCNLAVHATYPEASAVAKSLSVEQHEQLNLYIQRLKQALPALFDLKSYLKTHRQELGPCAFLDNEGSCTIYSIRPIVCRSLLSTRPAAWCTVDFTQLDEWDKQAYENGLDRSVVAWPTHYVAATQEYGRQLETEILNTMQSQHGWSLAGNFALMVWLAQQCQQDTRVTATQLHNILAANQLNSELLLTFTGRTP